MIDILEAGKLALDALRELRQLLKERQKKSLNPMRLGTLLELYGASTRLYGRCTTLEHQLRIGIDASDMVAVENYRSLQVDLRQFLNKLHEMSLLSIEIYYPDLRKELRRLVKTEICTLSSIEAKFGSKYRPLLSTRRELLRMVVEDFEPLNLELRNSYPEKLPEPLDEHGPFSILLHQLAKCRDLLAVILRENWNFREIVEQQP